MNRLYEYKHNPLSVHDEVAIDIITKQDKDIDLLIKRIKYLEEDTMNVIKNLSTPFFLDGVECKTDIINEKLYNEILEYRERIYTDIGN